MNWDFIIKVVAPILAVAGALIAATRYVTQLQDRIESNNELQGTRNRIAQLEQESISQQTKHAIELKDMQDKLNELAARYEKTDTSYRLLLESGNSAVALKASIDKVLQETADRLNASAHSILIPGPSIVADAPLEHLIFLCLEPSNPGLRKERISVDSIAGQVFRDQKTVVTHDPASAGAFSSQTDQVGKFKTANMLVAPLRNASRCVGVVEFLNKRNGASFDPVDIDLVEEVAGALGPKVAEFTGDPRNLKTLGFTPRQRPIDASILVSDISSYSKFVSDLDASVVIDLTNQYMDALCDVGIQYGGTVEQLQGDGFIMTFNVRRALKDHRSAAFEAALGMQQCFGELKSKWQTLKYSGAQGVFNRIGVSSGPVHKAEMGPSQFRQITVMGDAVNVAAHLCQYAARERNVIVAAKSLYERLEPKPVANPANLKNIERTIVELAFEISI